jgi:GNAT superfamily N-acetyltransferase
MTLEIRPLLASDQADWRRLWTAYLDFYESAISEEVYAATFARQISDDYPHQGAYLALLDGKAVGLVHYILHAHNWRVEDVVYLQDLYADPEVRGQGIGRALIQQVYDFADKNGTPTVYWMTQEFNSTARQLYDRIAHVTPFIKYQR